MIGTPSNHNDDLSTYAIHGLCHSAYMKWAPHDLWSHLKTMKTGQALFKGSFSACDWLLLTWSKAPGAGLDWTVDSVSTQQVCSFKEFQENIWHQVNICSQCKNNSIHSGAYFWVNIHSITLHCSVSCILSWAIHLVSLSHTVESYESLHKDGSYDYIPPSIPLTEKNLLQQRKTFLHQRKPFCFISLGGRPSKR